MASKQAQDEHTLAELGYKQELRRDWSVMHNFGISFSIIVSIPLPSSGLLDYAYQTCLSRRQHWYIVLRAYC